MTEIDALFEEGKPELPPGDFDHPLWISPDWPRSQKINVRADVEFDLDMFPAQIRRAISELKAGFYKDQAVAPGPEPYIDWAAVQRTIDAAERAKEGRAAAAASRPPRKPPVELDTSSLSTAAKKMYTPGECRVLYLFKQGLNPRQIAQRLQIQVATVNQHISAMKNRYSDALQNRDVMLNWYLECPVCREARTQPMRYWAFFEDHTFRCQGGHQMRLVTWKYSWQD